MKASSESGLCATVIVRVFGEDAVLLGIMAGRKLQMYVELWFLLIAVEGMSQLDVVKFSRDETYILRSALSFSRFEPPAATRTLITSANTNGYRPKRTTCCALPCARNANHPRPPAKITTSAEIAAKAKRRKFLFPRSAIHPARNAANGDRKS